MTTASLLAALGFTSVLIFKTDGKKADGTPLYFRRPKDGKEGVMADYRIVVPEHAGITGLGAKLQAAAGMQYIAAFLAIHGQEGEKAEYLQLRLFPNDKKTTEAQPSYRGFLEKGVGDDALRIADASAFMKTDKNGHPFLSIALQEPYVRPDEPSADTADECSIPF